MDSTNYRWKIFRGGGGGEFQKVPKSKTGGCEHAGDYLQSIGTVLDIIINPEI